MAEALQAIRHYIESPGDRPAFCCFINAHCLNIAYKNREYADLLNQADRVWADGVGVEIAAKHVGNPVQENVNGTDMLPPQSLSAWRPAGRGGCRAGQSAETASGAKNCRNPSWIFPRP